MDPSPCGDYVSQESCRDQHGTLRWLLGVGLVIATTSLVIPWSIARNSAAQVEDVGRKAAVMEERTESIRADAGKNESRIVRGLEALQGDVRDLGKKIDRHIELRQPDPR